MGRADVGDHRQIGLGAAAEPFDLTQAPHAHLHHQGRRALPGFAQGEGHADIVVVVAAAGHHRPQAGQAGADQLPGGGLAGGAGNRHHRSREPQTPEAGELLIGEQGVVHGPDGPAQALGQGLNHGGLDAIALNHRRRRPRQGRLQEAMAIEAFPHQRHEQGASQFSPAVGADGLDQFAAGGVWQRPPGLTPERQQRIEAQSHHTLGMGSNRIMPDPTRAFRPRGRCCSSTSSKRS